MYKKSVRLSPANHDVQPFMVFWELTRACDLSCRHCRAEAQPLRDSHELRRTEIETLLDELAPVRPLLILTGGDCFKRDDLEDIAMMAVERHIPTAISPSATPLVTEKRLANLYRIGVRAASISLDGASSETHDAFRRVPGAFAMTMKMWDWLHKIGFKVQINTSLTASNVDELPDIARLVMERRAMTWSLFFLVKTGRGRFLRDLNARGYEDVMHWLYDIGHWIPVKTTEGHHYKRIVIQRNTLNEKGVAWQTVLKPGPLYEKLTHAWHEKVPYPARKAVIRPPMHLNVGNGILFIDHRGNVYPGGFLPIPCGNARESSVLDIYRNHPLFRKLRNPATWRSWCSRCKYRDVCGGSRSRAYSLLGSPFASDPRCLYRGSNGATQEFNI